MPGEFYVKEPVQRTALQIARAVLRYTVPVSPGTIRTRVSSEYRPLFEQGLALAILAGYVRHSREFPHLLTRGRRSLNPFDDARFHCDGCICPEGNGEE